MNDFQEQLAWSQEASDEAFWLRVYRKAFPHMQQQVLVTGDCQAQRLGIDRVIILQSGRKLQIDEKKRTQVWDDIALEFLSNSKTGARGWIEKDLQIDYMAYAFMPTHTVHLFPWDMLKRAWHENGRAWKQKYRVIDAQNDGYFTRSVCVPIRTLQAAIHHAQIIVAPPNA